MVAIDPGGVHCGVALFNPEGRCYQAYEVGPRELADYLELWLEKGVVDVVVCESFQLYEDKAMAQVGSQMETCEVIGVVKYLVRRWGGEGVELVMQPAGIKEATAKILRAKGVVSLSKANRAGPHALDAELHGQHYLHRRGST